MRPDKTEYYLGIAKAVAQRSTCLRRQFGAVIVNNDQIVSTGYNGSPRGTTNCCDTGVCRRQEMEIPAGERYELCEAVHAEQNAIISASRDEMYGGTIYIWGWDLETDDEADCKPCKLCARMLKNAGVDSVIQNNVFMQNKRRVERIEEMIGERMKS